MSLTAIMSNAGLAIYAEVALVIFLLVFVGVLLRVLHPSRRDEMDAAGRMPLDDDSHSPPPSDPPRGEE